MPQTSYFAMGPTVRDLNQVFAAGHGLALGPWWSLQYARYYFGETWNNPKVFPWPPGWPSSPRDSALTTYIQTLLTARTTYKDALVYGQQSMPATTAGVAYRYGGTSNAVIALVNTTPSAISAQVTLGVEHAGQVWTDALSTTSPPDTATVAADGTLTLSAAAVSSTPGDTPGGLAVYTRALTTPGPTPATFPVTQTVPLMDEPLLFSFSLDDWTIAYGDVGFSPCTTCTLGGWCAPCGLSLNNALVFYARFSGGNFTYSGDVTIDSVGPSPGGGEASLLFRASANPQADDVADNGYAVQLSTATNTVTLVDLKWGMTLGSAPLTVTVGHTYSIAITAKGKSIDVSVDGVPMLSKTDSHYSSGRFAVGSNNCVSSFTKLVANEP
jgi:hypothetical protein